MEIRNGLTVLTKIASVFPVMKKSGVNLERRVCLLLSTLSFGLDFLASN